MKLQHALAFDLFVLDPVAGGLYGRSGAVPLTPKAYAMLEYLAANAGRLATKRELLDALWPRGYVTDGVLKVCIREIRRALGDDARAPRVIETAHRRGYRFIAATGPVSSSEPVTVVAPVAAVEVVTPVDRAAFAVRHVVPTAAGSAARLAAPVRAVTNSSLLCNRSLMNRMHVCR